MIVLDFIRELKQNVKNNDITFSQLLAAAKTIDFENKETILTHFESIDIKEKDSFIHLKYNNKKMFKQPWDAFYMATRALVVDWINEKLVLYPFDKFFELDEHRSSTLKEIRNKIKTGKTIEITEKIDGSLIVARYYKGNLLVVSSGALVGPHVDIATEILNSDAALLSFIKKHPTHTVMLEMKNSKIPQLIKYNEDKLTVIGMRDMNTLRCLSRSEILDLLNGEPVNVVPEFELSVDEMLSIMEDSTTSNNEGYILRIDDFLAKMKAKNFILANRFAGEPARNFNMIVEAINEGRVEYIRPMIKTEFLESFDISVGVLQQYAYNKEKKLLAMYHQIDTTAEMSEFVLEAQRKFHPYVKELIAIKNNRYNRLSKEDIKHLKHYSEFFTCVSHFKYAQIHNLELDAVVSDIKSGKIKFLKKFFDSYNNVDVYIIHKWQWLDFDSIKQF